MPERDRTPLSEEVNLLIRMKVREIEDVLWTLEWKSPYYGDISGLEFFFDELADGSGVRMGMTLFVHDSDDQGFNELHSLHTSVNVDPYEEAKQQVRGLIHGYLCHEADEQLWIEGERPFYPEHPQLPEVKA